ncbi:MAG: copper homeostasis protein CutC [Sphaerochaetaceae bacterium]|nr:copper homeostasis protein CutC [Sphaerochaetaceae bacterium]
MPDVSKVLIEICLESVESVIAAEQGGADRVELCSDLFEGGCTPSLGTFRTAKRLVSIPMNVMIRPRGGDFCYSDHEFEVMKEDARVFKEEGANAIVFGILTPDGEIDMERSQELIDIVRPLPVTFHRAIDMTRDASRSLEKLIKLGVDRVLTSGLEPTVPEGVDTLTAMVRQAGDRIVVMPGCGITERNFPSLHAKIQAKEYHVFLPREFHSRMEFHPDHIYMGGVLRQSEFTVSHTDAARVKDVRSMV